MSYSRIKTKNGEKQFFRFTLHQRAQHITLFSCVILLSLTGFPLKYHDSSWASGFYNFFGGIYVATIIHRVTGVILTSLFLYHTGTLVYAYLQRLRSLKEKGEYKNPLISFLTMEMVPNKRDLTDFIQHIMYLLYLREEKPHYERMSWKEKFDYFAPYWGIPVVASAGLILWFREPVSHFLPGIFYNAAYIMHTDEVLLAAMYLSCVHWYNVHYAPEKFPMATVFLTGYLSEEEMIEEHYGEYERTLREEGREAEVKRHSDISRKGTFESFLYISYTLVIMGFVIWYAALATRLIFHSHGGDPGEATAATLSAAGRDDVRNISASGFHGSAIKAETDRTNPCVPCHTEVPHNEAREGIEPLLNMHASYIACVTCHVKNDGPPTFRWYDVRSGSVIESLPRGMLVGKENKGSYGAKIVSGVLKDGRFEPLRGDSGSGGGETLERRNHRNINRTPLRCMDCHKKEGGYLPFETLGYPLSRVAEISGDEMAALAEKYQKLFEEGEEQ